MAGPLDPVAPPVSLPERLQLEPGSFRLEQAHDVLRRRDVFVERDL